MPVWKMCPGRGVSGLPVCILFLTDCLYTIIPYCQSDDCKQDYSIYPDVKETIDFLTRGCINKCYFCLVQVKEGEIFRYRTVDQIMQDHHHSVIRFLDNNILSHPDAISMLQELVNKNIRCYFENFDIRLVNEVNAELISKLNYATSEYIFAFDQVIHKPIIDKKILILKKYIPKDWKLKFDLFCDANSPVRDLITRINWCSKHRVLPYVMRYENCYKSDMKDFYTDISAWCNQPGFFKKLTFEQFLNKRHKKKDRISDSLLVYNMNGGID